MIKITFALLILLMSFISCAKEPTIVEIKKTEEGYQLFRYGKPFYIKGAGGSGDIKTLAEYGGNSIRTWV